MRQMLVVLVVIAGMVALMWVPRAPAEDVMAPNPDIVLTDEVYDAIQPGMTVDQVQGLIGGLPSFIEPAVSPAGTRTVRMMWKDRYGSSVYLRTDGVAVTQKIGSDLKPLPANVGL